MDSINVNGVSFRWSDDQLLITTAHGQDLLSATSAAQLLDFLLLETIPFWGLIVVFPDE